MKKIFLVLALAASLQVANAQNAKTVAAAKSALDKAAAAAENPKQNTKMATWLKYGQALLDAYAAPAGNLWVGMSQQDMMILGGSEKPVSEEDVVLEGVQMHKLVYANKNVYINPNGQVALIEVTQHITENPLGKATDAFAKANELDPSGSKFKEISEGLKKISESYVDEAYVAYTQQNDALASELFEKAFNTTGTAPLSQIDTNTLYNAGFTAFRGQNFDRAKAIFNKCLGYGYAGEMGDIYAKLSTIAEKQGDAAAAKNYLEEGFQKYPQSQAILVGLINYYLSTGEDTNRLFSLLDEAKRNEPNNASLYYVEGNIRKQLGQTDEAIAAYNKCGEIDPKYEYGYVGLGILYYDLAVDIQDKASTELNDAKYNAMMADFEKALKNCIEPFEKAYEITAGEDTKAGIAEYLKNACFRFRNESPEYMAKYEKYAGK